MHDPAADAASPLIAAAAPRYSNQPFPPYRYRPGRHPHPTADPRGHSFVPPGAPHHEVDCPDPDDWAASPEYLFACDLYNHAYWWEAHETWEALWQRTDKSALQGRFLQGLIQAAACHLKRLVGPPAGFERLRETHLRLLRSAAAELDPARGYIYMGLNLPLWIAALECYHAAPAVDPRVPPPHDPPRFPYIRLIDVSTAHAPIS